MDTATKKLTKTDNCREKSRRQFNTGLAHAASLVWQGIGLLPMPSRQVAEYTVRQYKTVRASEIHPSVSVTQKQKSVQTVFLLPTAKVLQLCQILS